MDVYLVSILNSGDRCLNLLKLFGLIVVDDTNAYSLFDIRFTCQKVNRECTNN